MYVCVLHVQQGLGQKKEYNIHYVLGNSVRGLKRPYLYSGAQVLLVEAPLTGSQSEWEEGTQREKPFSETQQTEVNKEKGQLVCHGQLL